jgi:hypothetical protein
MPSTRAQPLGIVNFYRRLPSACRWRSPEITMNIINLTPHPVNIRRTDGTFLNLPKCETPARCAAKLQNVASINGIAINCQSFGEVQNLPEEQPDTYFLVSLIVAQAAKNRSDLVSPGTAIRGPDGVQVGCDGLSVL